MKNNRSALNYRPIISITPSKRRIPVDNHDLMELDECIEKKIKENNYEQEMAETISKSYVVKGYNECVSDEQGYTLNRVKRTNNN